MTVSDNYEIFEFSHTVFMDVLIMTKKNKPGIV